MTQSRLDVLAQAMTNVSFAKGADAGQVTEVAMKPKRVITPNTASQSNLLDQFGFQQTEDEKTARK